VQRPGGIGSPSPAAGSATAARASATSRASNGVGVAPNRRRGSTVQPKAAAASSHAARSSRSIAASTSDEVAQVEHHSQAPATAVMTPGSRASPDRADARRGAGDLADGPAPPAPPRERVAAQVHGRRAGVRRLPREAHEVALVAERAADRRRQPPRVEQHRALLDVQLEVSEDAVEPRGGRAGAVEVDAAGRERVLQPHAVAVAQVADVVGVELARDGRRAEQASPEAGALLIGPVDEPHGDLWRLADGGERAQDAERREDPERAVEPAAGRHRVDVRAHDDDLGRAPGQLGHRLPASSRSTVTGSSASLPFSHSRAASQSGDQARRRAPSGPPWRSCSSRSRRARGRRRRSAPRSRRHRGAVGRPCDEAAVPGDVRISPWS
jgi:hypothetical protein